MAITNYEIIRAGRSTRVIVTSDLGGTVFYHWYLDGVYVGRTELPEYCLFLDVGEQVVLVCQDTADADYDPIANAPAGYPARRLIYWVRSLATDLDYYQVEQKPSGGEWTNIGRAAHDPQRWDYWLLTPRLADLTSHQWRVVPIDRAGREGTTIAIDAMTVVRTPDAPGFAISYDAGTDKVTYTAA